MDGQELRRKLVQENTRKIMTSFISRVLSIMNRHHRHCFSNDTIAAEPIHMLTTGRHGGIERHIAGYRLYCSQCGTGREFYAVKK